ncbi:MAG: DUF11 domain-containing protein [Gemmataceae bacterium]|nr:DUF11 domain-containing protein [Gemmataceae bacterium]MDW8265327.1 DUF11 domain-containing protein [Gemmataceae bacterium]
MIRTVSVVLLVLALAPALRGQALLPLPSCGPSPLLYVRLEAPPGTVVTFFPDPTSSRRFSAPVAVGLRPGYIYRVKLSNLPDTPGVSLAPTLEVLSTLKLSPQQRAADYPAPVRFSSEEIERVLEGALLTKIVILENPETAAGVATRPTEPLVIDVPQGRDPMLLAREWGRPMLIVRLGQREVSDQELACSAVPGTVLLPGDGMLSPPARPPSRPWRHVPVYDPILGPKPLIEECFHDGGDRGPRLNLAPDGRLLGLNPSDTAAEYADSRGHKHVVASNSVCLCVPRYVIARMAAVPAGYEMAVGVAGREAVQPQGQLHSRLPSRSTQQTEHLDGLKGRLRPSAQVSRQALDRIVRLEVLQGVELPLGPGDVLGTQALHRLSDVERLQLQRQLDKAIELGGRQGVRGWEQLETTAVVGRVEGLGIVSGTLEVRDVTVCCEKPCPPEKPLVLWKWVDRHDVQVGDVVTFHIKYSNVGGKPIRDIAVSDSLTPRLEYVPGTARSDRDAVFTVQENEAGSVILRWEISGVLLPGQQGVVSFQARIR